MGKDHLIFPAPCSMYQTPSDSGATSNSAVNSQLDPDLCPAALGDSMVTYSILYSPCE